MPAHGLFLHGELRKFTPGSYYCPHRNRQLFLFPRKKFAAGNSDAVCGFYCSALHKISRDFGSGIWRELIAAPSTTGHYSRLSYKI